jgi:hypothetical protein
MAVGTVEAMGAVTEAVTEAGMAEVTEAGMAAATGLIQQSQHML